jgi:hypothetical protein
MPSSWYWKPDFLNFHFNEDVQKVRFPLRVMTSVMAGVEYGFQPKIPLLT